MVIDPIADLVNRLKNASRAGQVETAIPFSKMKYAVSELLRKEGFVGDIREKGKGVKKDLVVELNYNGKKPRIAGVKRVSKPSRRLYTSVKEIIPVKNGRGRMVLSTPQGIMTGKQAREAGIGGEILFLIW